MNPWLLKLCLNIFCGYGKGSLNDSCTFWFLLIAFSVFLYCLLLTSKTDSIDLCLDRFVWFELTCSRLFPSPGTHCVLLRPQLPRHGPSLLSLFLLSSNSFSMHSVSTSGSVNQTLVIFVLFSNSPKQNSNFQEKFRLSLVKGTYRWMWYLIQPGGVKEEDGFGCW